MRDIQAGGIPQEADQPSTEFYYLLELDGQAER
jgi:hypothetical protein